MKKENSKSKGNIKIQNLKKSNNFKYNYIFIFIYHNHINIRIKYNHFKKNSLNLYFHFSSYF